MASYLDGVRTGFGMVESAADEYHRSRSWADRLTEREAAKEAAARAAELEADRYAQGRGDKAAEREAASAKFARTQAEVERHNRAMEGQWAPGSRGRAPGSGTSGDLTPKVAAAEAFKMLKGYEGNPANMPEAEFGQYQTYLKIANPNHAIQPYKKAPTFWERAIGRTKEPAKTPKAFDWAGK